MSTTLTLPSGHTVSLREKREITERQRRPFMQLQAAMGLGTDTPAAQRGADMLASIDAGIVVCVIGWSFEFPVTADALQDLSIGDYDELRDECMKTLSETSPSFTPSPAPESPTSPAQP